MISLLIFVFLLSLLFIGTAYIKIQNKYINSQKELIFYKIEYLSNNFLQEILKEYNLKKKEIIKAHKYLLSHLKKEDIQQIKKKLGPNFHIFVTNKNFVITHTTFKYDQNFSLAFVKDLLMSHKTIHVSPPICEPATTNFISFSDVYKNGIVTQIGYIYKNPKINYFKEQIKKIKQNNPFIKEITLYFIHPKTKYAQQCNIITPLYRKYTLKEMKEARKEGMKLYRALLKKNPIITKNAMYILSYNPFEKESYVILKIDINYAVFSERIKKMAAILIFTFIIISLIGTVIVLLINSTLKTLESFTQSIKNETVFKNNVEDKNLKEVITAYNNTLKKLQEAIKSKDDFIHFALHELATPISILTLYMDDYDELKPAIKKLYSSYKNMSYYIDKNHKRVKKINLKELVSKRIEYFKDIAKSENKKIIASLEDFYICANEEDMEILIDNNIKNALKYSTSEAIRINLKKNVLSFENGGIISDKEKIFKKFYREENVKGGFGLGLYIIKTIAEKYEIKIDVLSENKTVKFIYTLKESNENCSN
ncbi:signal transduction histidine kinase [Caminibacter pacificus]|uniref:histidine kinase n=1 Tax=Caminibacter pacificus TaxID=1424653 RepID=A0AAJ4RCE0_9BACT|nr:signal transduction histidine kinase [Caminibacter pacificus]